MTHDNIIALLRQINCSMPLYSKMMPKSISSLTFSQVYLLDKLYCKPKNGSGTVYVSSLARESGFSRSSVCATLKSLRKLGFVQMQVNREDNRLKEIILSERGHIVESDVKKYVHEYSQALCAGITGDETEQLEKLLRVILKNARNTREMALVGSSLPSAISIKEGGK